MQITTDGKTRQIIVEPNEKPTQTPTQPIETPDKQEKEAVPA